MVSGKSMRLASTMATVIPDTRTVRPAVATVRATASCTVLCLCNSSRNRVTRNSP